MSKRITDTDFGRLTDAELADIGERIGMEEIHPTECEQMLAEIRASRAAALTPSEVEALVYISAAVESANGRLVNIAADDPLVALHSERCKVAAAAIAKLLAASEPKP